MPVLGVLKGKSMLRQLFGAVIIVCTLAAGAQTVHQAGPSIMAFEDSVYGVSFRYPLRWTFIEHPDFFSLASPAGASSSDNSDPTTASARAAVSTTSVLGVPRGTNFSMAGFTYAVREETTPDDCRYLAAIDNLGQPPDDVTVNGHIFHHGRSSGVGTGHHVIGDDVYTLTLGRNCLLFDLTVDEAGFVAGEKPLRGLTARESRLVDAELHSILAGVHFANLAMFQGSSGRSTPTKQFADPQSGVSFLYPAAWNFETVDTLVGPEDIFTTAQGPDGDPISTARAIVSIPQPAWRMGHENTDLTGADFIFNVIPAPTAEACLNSASRERNVGNASTRLIDEIPFRYVSYRTAYSCHQAFDSIYAHQEDGQCLLFEEAIHTVCPSDNARSMNASEIRDLRFQLQQILGSVKLHSKSNPSELDPHP